MKRYWALVGVLGCVLWGVALASPLPVHASCTVEIAAGNYSDGKNLRDDKCDQYGDRKVTLGTALTGEDSTDGGAFKVRAAPVQQTTLASGITTNTTSAPVAIPSGVKTVFATITGTGAITQTIDLYAGPTTSSAATSTVLVCTITLSGTAETTDACPPFSLNAKYWFIKSSSTTGTGTTGAVYVEG